MALEFPVTCNLKDNKKLQVYVVGIGKITEEHFNRYYNLVTKFNTFHISEMTFRNHHYSSECDETVEYFFVKNYSELLDPCPNYFQLKVLGIIGIVDCREQVDLVEASSLFSKHVSMYNPFQYRCFAFEPFEDHFDSPTNIIVIPNQNRDQILFYLSTIMSNFAASIIDSISLIPQQHSKGSFKSFSGFLKNYDKFLTLEDEKKKTFGQYKFLGDIHLMCGNYSGALISYEESIENSTLMKNDFFLALSKEGYASALLYNNRGSDTEKRTISLLKESLNNDVSSNSLYLSSTITNKMFFLQCFIKTFHLMIKLKQEKEFFFFFTRFDLITDKFTDLEKRTFYEFSSTVYHHFNFKRKFFFFKRLISQLHLSNNNYTHSILRSSLEHYGINGLDFYLTNFLSTTYIDFQRFKITKGWSSLQIHILNDLIDSSNCSEDSFLSIGYLSFLLNFYGKLVPKEILTKTIQKLKTISVQNLQKKSIQWPFFPKILQLNFYRSHKQIYQKCNQTDSNIIFNPFVKSFNSKYLIG